MKRDMMAVENESINKVLKSGTDYLSGIGISDAFRNCEIILMHVLNKTREEIYRAVQQYVGKTKALFMVKNMAGNLSPLEKHTCEFCNLNFETILQNNR